MRFGLFCGICLMLLACSQTQVKSQPADSWVRVAPKSAFSGLSEVSLEDVFAISEDHLDAAIQDLQSAPSVKLTRHRASDLVGRPLPDGDYYLIRAVCGSCATGRYYVYFGLGRVIIDHLSLTSRPGVSRRWPIVARLPASPTDVYAQFSTIK